MRKLKTVNMVLSATDHATKYHDLQTMRFYIIFFKVIDGRTMEVSYRDLIMSLKID